ncbi:3-demethylubiquinone-9 3-methyltransferase [Gimesia alba]|uniref:3-demethylubiquinone-9 3-methyltransferase n=1 Tax=Gimesia alba TaxID=2527973 RepID=A0A517RC72_9PLAN|nr:VOC family protein [Gimesia alba]QDT41489.1 3-demethylubiquinone-9 3-methyltransferase [Gimesia alba]
MSDSPKIAPFLWFDDNAEAAIDHYTSIFKNSKKLSVSRYGEAGPGPAGSVMVASFELEGQTFIALNGGPMFKFNEAVSFAVNCDTQQEIDELWEKLTEEGEPGQCGWLKDKFGLSWQIVPSILPELMQGAGKSNRVMQALMQMTKIDIQRLQEASNGG